MRFTSVALRLTSFLCGVVHLGPLMFLKFFLLSTRGRSKNGDRRKTFIVTRNPRVRARYPRIFQKRSKPNWKRTTTDKYREEWYWNTTRCGSEKRDIHTRDSSNFSLWRMCTLNVSHTASIGYTTGSLPETTVTRGESKTTLTE